MSRIRKMAMGKCPNCEEGEVFREAGRLWRFEMPKMNDTCPVCNFRFEREPGYFFGAMFISYGLTIGEAITAYFLTTIFNLNLSLDGIMVVIVVLMLLLLFFNFRLSRLIWLYLFTSRGSQSPAESKKEKTMS